MHSSDARPVVIQDIHRQERTAGDTLPSKPIGNTTVQRFTQKNNTLVLNNNNTNKHNQVLRGSNGVVNGCCNGLVSTGKSKYIRVDGNIYDITNFIRHHPGGRIIEHFIDRDASDVFHAFHEKDVLRYRTPVGSYSRKNVDHVSEEFASLQRFLIKEGLFRTSYRWYAMKIGVTFIPLVVSVCLIMMFQHWFLHYTGAFFLALFFHQSGFFMHDFMHSQGTHDRKIDSLLGIFYATVCVGISGRWWRDEHFLHHALTCCVDYDTEFCDPQMKEAVWAQNEKLFPFFKAYLQFIAIKVQHITFIPMCILSGRVGVMADSFKDETRPMEWVAFFMHWTWVTYLLSHLSSWWEVFCVFLVSNCFFGVLIIQLLVSHYSKPFYFEKDVCNSQNWYRMQIESNINLACPVWMDWFHGGLNFHIEHHLYPTMPRHHYRKASEHVKRVCGELGLPYDECSLSSAVIRTLRHLKTTSKLFKLDPR